MEKGENAEVHISSKAEEHRALCASESSSSSCESSSDCDSVHSDYEEDEQPSTFTQKIDSFNEKKFQLHMRMKRKTVDYLVSQYSEFLLIGTYADRDRNDAKTSVYMYLWYMGTIISFRQLGRLFRVSRISAWISVRQVTACINKFGHEFVKWPQGEEVKASQDRFQQTKGIPGVVGAIDCSRLKITAPRLVKYLYLNGTQSYSLVIQGVVDGFGKFIDIACQEPGSLHETDVLLQSDLYSRAQTSKEEMFPQNSVVLGGAAYPLTSWLVTPFNEDAALTEPQRKFNEIHHATRAVARETLDLVKRRFPRLMKFTEDINVGATKNLVMGVYVLHNLCLFHEDHYDDVYSVCSYGFAATAPKLNFESSAVADTGGARRDELFDALREQNVI